MFETSENPAQSAPSIIGRVNSGPDVPDLIRLVMFRNLSLCESGSLRLWIAIGLGTYVAELILIMRLPPKCCTIH
jgi:hypothetical protein